MLLHPVPINDCPIPADIFSSQSRHHSPAWLNRKCGLHAVGSRNIWIFWYPWIFPQAPYPASPGGFSWYDGDKISGWKHTASFSLLDKLVLEQFENGFTANDLFLLGFSQGASLVLEYMIRQRFSMAGVIAIAGFIHDKKRFVRETTPESKNSRVLLIHGEKDQVIYPSASEKAHKLLHESGYQSELQILQSSHKVSLSAKPLIEKFLTLH